MHWIRALMAGVMALATSLATLTVQADTFEDLAPPAGLATVVSDGDVDERSALDQVAAVHAFVQADVRFGLPLANSLQFSPDDPGALIVNVGAPSINDEDMLPLSIAARPEGSEVGWICRSNGYVRRVFVDYASPEAPVPCAVRYFKETETPDEISTLWNAQSEAGYCERKARDFVSSLDQAGWSCDEGE